MSVEVCAPAAPTGTVREQVELRRAAAPSLPHPGSSLPSCGKLNAWVRAHDRPVGPPLEREQPLYLVPVAFYEGTWETCRILAEGEQRSWAKNGILSHMHQASLDYDALGKQSCFRISGSGLSSFLFRTESHL